MARYPARRMVRLAVTAAITAAFTVASVATAHAGPGATRPPGATGAIRGTVVFDGAAPERARLRRESDPYCAKSEAFADDVVVTNGKLRDVLVRVKNGALPAVTSPPAPA